MTNEESETKFDKLVSTTFLILETNLLTRVPSLKNMRSLRELYLESNKITRIAPGIVWHAPRWHTSEWRVWFACVPTVCLPSCLWPAGRLAFAGDFAGATQLVVLSLAGNRIVEVAAEAFGNLKALQFKPEDFEPAKADNTTYKNVYNAGAHTVCPGGCVCV